MATRAEVADGPVVATGIRSGQGEAYLAQFTREFPSRKPFENWEKRKDAIVRVAEVRYGTKAEYLAGKRGALVRPAVEVQIGN
jgi:hypothetical protein